MVGFKVYKGELKFVHPNEQQGGKYAFPGCLVGVLPD